jgi:hypothetical protein
MDYTSIPGFLNALPFTTMAYYCRFTYIAHLQGPLTISERQRTDYVLHSICITVFTGAALANPCLITFATRSRHYLSSSLLSFSVNFILLTFLNIYIYIHIYASIMLYFFNFHFTFNPSF